MRLSILSLCAVLVSSSISFAEVQIGNIKIKDDGKIVFSDNSEQSTAALKGDVGPQGPKGDQGPPGQVNKEALCQMYSTEGVSLPPFCSKKFIFITSQTFNGNLGGLEGADAKCQTAASAGGLTGSYKAWLSDSVTNARDRLTHNPAPYIRTDGALVANNWLDLIDGNLKDSIFCDEYKNCAVYIDVPETRVFTATAFNGIGGNGPSGTCMDWASNAQAGIEAPVGNYMYADRSWSHWGSTYCTDGGASRLYCIEQ